VTERPGEADDLRLAFQRVADAASLEGVDVERVWRAVSGEAPAEERREVVEMVARDPSWALTWRAAHELWTASRETARARRIASGWSSGLGWGALAAGLLVAVGLGIWGGRTPAPPTHREGATTRIESLLPDGQTRPRVGVVLRWTGPPGATYDVRITSEDLLRVHTATGLKKGEYRIPEEFLAPFPPAARVLWQVQARLPDGETRRSETFVMKLE
jgi:hypothetical protein